MQQGAAAVPDETDDRPRNGRANYLLGMLTLLYTISMIDRTIINTLAQQIKLDLKLSDTELGAVTGIAFALLYATMSFPLARLAERSSRRNLISATLAFWSAATALCGVGHTFWQLFLARLGVGMGEAGFMPAAQSMISDSFPERRRAAAMSIFSLGVPLGTLLGAVLGGWLGQAFGWRAAFLAIGLPGLLLAGIFHLTIREPSRGAFDAPTADASSGESLRATMSVLLSSVPFISIIAAFTFAAIAGYSLGAFFVAFMQRAFGLPLVQASTAFGLISGLSGAVGMLLGGYLATRLGQRRPAMQYWVPGTALLLAGPIMATALLQDDLRLLWPLLIAGSILYPTYIGCGYAAAHNLFPTRYRATATSLILLISTLAGLGLGPVGTGMISDFVTHAAYSGDYAAACTQVREVACQAAETQGLRTALVAAMGIYLLAGLSLFIGGRALVRSSDRNTAPVPA